MIPDLQPSITCFGNPVLRLHKPSILLVILLPIISGCNRQYVVTVNNQSVYDPRITAGRLQVTDPDLQGCVNLALVQQSVRNPAELTTLSCANANVSDLRGIGQLSNLRFLDLALNNISDLQPLTSLSQLRGLSIPDNPLTDISPLLDMDSLTAVILTGNDQLPCSQLDRLEQRLENNLTRPQNCLD